MEMAQHPGHRELSSAELVYSEVLCVGPGPYKRWEQMPREPWSSFPPRGSPSLLSCFTNGETGSQKARVNPGPSAIFVHNLRRTILRDFYLLSSVGLHFRKGTSPQTRWGEKPSLLSGGEEQVFASLALGPHSELLFCPVSSPHRLPASAITEGETKRLTNKEIPHFSIMVYILG